MGGDRGWTAFAAVWICCLIFHVQAFAQSEAFETTAVSPGFYTSHEFDGARALQPFGPYLYIHKHVYWDPAKKRPFYGWRGYFATAELARGLFFASIDSQGQVHHAYTAIDPVSGKVRNVPVQIQVLDGKIFFEFQETGGHWRTLELRLAYAGADADPGLATRYLSHRGYSYFPVLGNTEALYPGNTMPAFEQAVDLGYHGFELDLRVTADSQFVVSHDQKLSIATTCSGNVNDHELKRLEKCTVVASTHIPELTAYRSPLSAPMVSLNAVLRRFLPDPRVKRIVLDVKPDMAGFIAVATWEAFEGLHLKQDLHKKIMFVARDEDTLELVKSIFKNFDFALEGSMGTEPLSKPNRYMPVPMRYHNVVSAKMGTLGMPPSDAIRNLVSLAHQRGYQILAWALTRFQDLMTMRRIAPSTGYVLTDATMDVLARLRLVDLAKADRIFIAEELPPLDTPAFAAPIPALELVPEP